MVGLSFALGAFVAGMVLSESDFGHQALSDIIPVRDLFGAAAVRGDHENVMEAGLDVSAPVRLVTYPGLHQRRVGPLRALGPRGEGGEVRWRLGNEHGKCNAVSVRRPGEVAWRALELRQAGGLPRLQPVHMDLGPVVSAPDERDARPVRRPARLASLVISGRCPVPSARIIHSRPSRRSRMMLMPFRTYTTRCPSGAIWTSDGYSSWKTSRSEKGVWAARGTDTVDSERLAATILNTVPPGKRSVAAR